MRILDVGCGVGQNLGLLSKKGNYYGIDISSKNIENNKKYFPKYKFEVTDITKKTIFKDGFFDQIFCYDVLEHVDNLDNALNEIHRIINKTTGKLVVEVPSYFTETIFTKLNPNYNEQVGHKRCLAENEWIETIQKHGFYLHQKQLKKFKDLLYLSHKFFRGKKIISDMGEFDEGIVSNEDLLNTKIWLTENQYVENLFSDLYGKSLRLEFKTKPCKLISPKKIPDELDQLKQEKEKIKSENQNLSKQIGEVNKIVLNYQSENQNLSKQIEEVNINVSDIQTNLNTITSSKYYKIWRLYCKIKDTIK